MLDFVAVFDASPNPYMLVDRELRYVAVNKAYCDATHRPAEQLIGQPVFEQFPHDPDSPNNAQSRRVADSLRHVFATGVADTLSLIHYRIEIDGSYQDIYWSATHTPVRDASGAIAYVLQHTVNVTEIQRSRATPFQIEAAILDRAQAGERNLRDLLSVFDQAPGFLAVTRGPTHVFELANPGYRKIVGGRDVVGRTVAQALPELDDYFLGLLDDVYQTGKPFVGNSAPVTLENESGEPTEIFVDFIYQPLNDVNGNVGGIMVFGHDVTARVRAERAREHVQSELVALARVLGETRDFVGIAGLDGMPTFANAAALKLIGLPDFEAAKRIHVVNYFVEQDRTRVREEVIPAALADGFWQGELCFLHQQTGEAIPVWYTIFPIRDGRGAINGLATITRDLRPQKEAENERVALLDAERAARAQAERATLLMDQFLATVSHELRTPLSAILGWTQMLRTGTLSAEKHDRALATVERNAQMQAHLVEDLLDVSRIITGKLTMEMERTDLAASVAAAVETVRPTAQAKGVALDIDISGATIVNGDSSRLQQVVWNLLSNAVKFTPAEGRVALRVTSDHNAVEIRVTDTGVGIPADFLPHVFDRFRQADGSSTRRRGGLGLGLSIVSHVVEAHGGTVTAQSEGTNRGSCFTVRIPRVRSRLFRTLSPTAAPAISLKGLKILVVDDEEDTREFVRNLLEQNAASVIEAASAADAIAAVQREQPDLLLSDLGMPDEDGFSLIRRIRALPIDRGGKIPAVALTAYARSEDRTRAMLAGFQNHVPKPVVPNELLAVLASLRGD